jgi:hypothetical protein
MIYTEPAGTIHFAGTKDQEANRGMHGGRANRDDFRQPAGDPRNKK